MLKFAWRIHSSLHSTCFLIPRKALNIAYALKLQLEVSSALQIRLLRIKKKLFDVVESSPLIIKKVFSVNADREGIR